VATYPYRDGLFEDDTFSDLEGMDAAEKILLLARELGFSMEMQDLDIEPLAVRRPIVNWDYITDEFKAEDESMWARARAAAARGCTLRYVQRIECDPATELGGQHDFSNVSVSSKLEEVPVGSAHAMVKGALYHFSFHTGRYSQAPLIVQVSPSPPCTHTCTCTHAR
jgi:homoserine O-acetyltransferase